jgi:hypothetical protein
LFFLFGEQTLGTLVFFAHSCTGDYGKRHKKRERGRTSRMWAKVFRKKENYDQPKVPGAATCTDSSGVTVMFTYHRSGHDQPCTTCSFPRSVTARAIQNFRHVSVSLPANVSLTVFSFSFTRIKATQFFETESEICSQSKVVQECENKYFLLVQILYCISNYLLIA